MWLLRWADFRILEEKVQNRSFVQSPWVLYAIFIKNL